MRNGSNGWPCFRILIVLMLASICCFCSHKRFWLIVWTVNNIAVTIVNKALFAVLSFPYPFALTAVHMAICSSSICLVNNNKVSNNSDRQPLTGPDQVRIYSFSILFTMNIAIGNLAMKHVSINFDQTVRSLVPVVTMWLGSLLYGHIVSPARRRSVGPVVVGVALAVYGDRMYVTTTGFVATVLSVVLASGKVIVSSEFLTGKLKLAPLELLSYMAPAALLQCIVLSYWTGELAAIASRWSTELSPLVQWQPMVVLIASGILALGLNLTGLMAYQMTSPLTCCIAAAVKQILMIVVGTIIFQTNVSMINGAGIATVLLGSAYYSYLSVMEHRQQPPPQKQHPQLQPPQHPQPTSKAVHADDDGTADLSDEEAPLMELRGGDASPVSSRR
jgi:Triose-phosphate Transporter family